LSSVLSSSFNIWTRLHVSKHALLVSFAKFFKMATWLPSLILAAKFELGCQVGSQVQTWQTSQKKVMENILRPENLAAKLELGRAWAKFKLGCHV
jgi:hypothetical protein